MDSFYSTWESFLANVLPDIKDPQQIKNLKLVYYSGACNFMNAQFSIMEAALPEKDVDLELDAIEGEIYNFFEAYNSGRLH